MSCYLGFDSDSEISNSAAGNGDNDLLPSIENGPRRFQFVMRDSLTHYQKFPLLCTNFSFELGDSSPSFLACIYLSNKTRKVVHQFTILLPSLMINCIQTHNKMNDFRDKFPVGMHVLAVDGDRTCLKILETQLQRSRYQVTTAENAVMALKLLIKNKNKFDLVIGGVNMPDSDGFMLLELVGLQMDLPVILLSANDDPEMVMKGISLGACFYMLKPVRIEELKLIWQHVTRRTKSNNQSTPNFDNSVTANSSQNEKPSKKRKYQNEDDVEGHGNDHDIEVLIAPKKPRVFWSPELDSKFVDVVNQLGGLDKAVPREILALMNVENLTKENVASHLQKYRHRLKKKSCVANQQPNTMLTQFCPSYNDNQTKSYLPNSGTLGGNLGGASSITPLSSQPHDSLTGMNSQGGINHNQHSSYHSREIGSSSVDPLIPLNNAEPVTFSFVDSLLENEDMVAELLSRSCSSSRGHS